MAFISLPLFSFWSLRVPQSPLCFRNAGNISVLKKDRNVYHDIKHVTQGVKVQIWTEAVVKS